MQPTGLSESKSKSKKDTKEHFPTPITGSKKRKTSKVTLKAKAKKIKEVKNEQ